MKRVCGILCATLLGVAGGACSGPEEEVELVPYADPTAPFPDSFVYACPDYESEHWSCPFDGEPDDKVVFSGPLFAGASDTRDPTEFDYSLFYDTLRFIDSVPPGAKLRATTYYFTSSSWGRAVRDALLCAAGRGVTVDILIGDPFEPTLDGDSEHQSDTQEEAAKLESKSMLRPAVQLYSCTGACLREGTVEDGKQHSKFFTATHTCNGDGWDEAVVLTSSNNWTSSLVKRDNATLIKRNDGKLYKAFVQYFDRMLAAELEGEYVANYYDAPDGRGGFLGTGSGSDPNYTYHLFPRDEGPDPIEETLSQVNCTEGGEVRVAMSRWTRARAYLVDRFLGLAISGCNVRIIVGDEPTEYDLRQYLATIESQAPVGSFAHRRLASDVFHDKYFMIDAIMAPAPEPTRYVWAGSHNFSRSSLETNEETALAVRSLDIDGDGEPDNRIYEDFASHFEQQWARAVIPSEDPESPPTEE